MAIQFNITKNDAEQISEAIFALETHFIETEILVQAQFVLEGEADGDTNDIYESIMRRISHGKEIQSKLFGILCKRKCKSAPNSLNKFSKPATDKSDIDLPQVFLDRIDDLAIGMRHDPSIPTGDVEMHINKACNLSRAMWNALGCEDLEMDPRDQNALQQLAHEVATHTSAAWQIIGSKT